MELQTSRQPGSAVARRNIVAKRREAANTIGKGGAAAGPTVFLSWKVQAHLPSAAVASSTSGVPLIRLGSCQCRFPVREDPLVPGGHRFCAGPTSPDRVYCDHHHSIATAVDPRRPRSGFHLAQRRAA
ncbi:GcrA family cell cycle regulator [Mesorhizobium sp.]|uniref:GcrA family cell cycle regulator n=1 Tax=Mesorhizobium sp. TaxID=1871066 RepID=UPI00338EB83A